MYLNADLPLSRQTSSLNTKVTRYRFNILSGRAFEVSRAIKFITSCNFGKVISELESVHSNIEQRLKH